MPFALHPAGHTLGRKILERIPGVRLNGSSRTNTAVEISLVQILGKSLGEVTSKVFLASIPGQLASRCRILAIWIDVAEEFPARHVRAVCAGNAGKLLVELKSPELLRCPLFVDQVMNAAFKRRDADLRLAGFLGCRRRRGSPQYENKQRQQRASHTMNCSHMPIIEGEKSRHENSGIVG